MEQLTRHEMAVHASTGKQAWLNMINQGQFFDELRNAQTVRRDDFQRILEALVEVRRLSLHAVQDLIDAGLTIDGDPKKTIIGDENVSEMEDAKNSLNVTQLEVNDTVFAQTYAPQPIIHHTHAVQWRQNFGYKVTSGNRESFRKVMERRETNLVVGDSTLQIRFNDANQVQYGYTTHPDRETVAVDDWSAVTTNVLANVTSMMSAMYTSNKIEGGRGTFILYVPTNAKMSLRQQAFSAKGSNTFEQQILVDHPEISKLEYLVDLPTGNPVLVYMNITSVQMVISQAPIVVPHIKTLDILPSLFTTYAIETPLIHGDVNGKTGIVQGT